MAEQRHVMTHLQHSEGVSVRVERTDLQSASYSRSLSQAAGIRGRLSREDEDKIRNNWGYLLSQIDGQDLVYQVFQKNHFSEDDVQEIRNGRDQRERAHLFLSRLLRSGPDSFSVFLESLAASGYSEVYNRLTALQWEDGPDMGTRQRRGRLRPEDEAVLQDNHTFLLDELDGKDLVDTMFEKESFDLSDCERIKSLPTRRKRAEAFLYRLHHAGQESYGVFLAALQKAGYTGASEKLTCGQKMHKDSEDPRLTNLIKKSQMFIKDNLSTLFVPTKAYRKMEEILNTYATAILIGRPGDGKTTLAIHQLLNISEKCSCTPLVVTCPADWDLIPPPNNPSNIHSTEKYIVLIDDIFGRSNLSTNKLESWESKFSMMQPLVKSGQVQLLVTLRAQIYERCKVSLGNYKIFGNEHVLSLSQKESALTKEEMYMMLDIYLKHYEIDMSDLDMKQSIATVPDIGFPQCCSYFCSYFDGSTKSSLPGCEFFQNPLAYLIKNIEEMEERDPMSYCVLILVMLHGGQLAEDFGNINKMSKAEKCDISEICNICGIAFQRICEMRKVAKSLCSVYLRHRPEEKCFTISHQSLLDALFIFFCRKSLEFGINKCSLEMLLEYVTTTPPGHDDCVVVTKPNFQCLADRLIRELLTSNVDKILVHKAFRDDTFVRFLDNTWDAAVLDRLVKQSVKEGKLRTDLFCTTSVLSRIKDEVMAGVLPDYTLTIHRKPIYSCSYSTPLEIMIIKKLYPLSEIMLEKALNMQVSNSQKTNLLSCAAFSGSVTLVKQIIEKGITPTEESVVAACISGEDNVEILKILLQHPKLVSLPSWTNDGLLHLSMQQGKAKSLQFLLKNTQKMPTKQLVLDLLIIQLLWQFSGIPKPKYLGSYICKENNEFPTLEIFNILVNMGANCTADMGILASCHRNPEMLEKILNLGANANMLTMRKMTLLHLAAQYGGVKIIKLLITKGVDPACVDTEGNTPLHLASEYGTVEIVKCLLQSQINSEGDLDTKRICNTLTNLKNGNGYTPLDVAALRNQDIEMVKTLVEADVNIASESKQTLQLMIEVGVGNLDANMLPDETKFDVLEIQNHHRYVIKGILSLAARKKQLQGLLFLLQHGNYTDEHKAVLINAAGGSHVEVVKLLLNHGDDSDGKALFGRTAVSSAAEGGHVEVVKLLLDHGVDIKSTSGVTAISSAAERGHVEVVKLLLDHGVDIKSTYGVTAVSSAARGGHVEVLKVLLDHGANIKSKYGVTALSVAARSGHVEVVKLLLDHGVESNVKSKYRETALTHAAEGGHVEVVKLLLAHGADVKSEYGVKTLSSAARGGHTEVVKLLLDHGADGNFKSEYGETALTCSGEGHVEVVKLLLDHGADVTSEYGARAISNAARGGHVEVVKLLLDHGADSNGKDLFGRTALANAAREGHVEVVKFLLDHGADSNVKSKYGETALANAARRGHLEVVKLLLGHDAGSNHKDDLGWTALSRATRGGHFEIVKLLLDSGVDVKSKYEGRALSVTAQVGHAEIVKLLLDRGANVKSMYGARAVSNAAGEGHIEVVKLLLDHGGDSNGKDLYERTALSNAARGGHVEVVKLLLNHGASVKSKYGATALSNAAGEGNVEVVKLLLDSGADINAKSRDGETALDVAKRRRHDDVVRILQDSLFR